MKLVDAISPILFTAIGGDTELTTDTQTALQNDGLLRSAVDGIWGDDTQNALVRFKRIRNISGIQGANVLYSQDLQDLQRALKLGVPNLVSDAQGSVVYETQLYPYELADLNKCLHVYNICSVEQIREFLAQTAHESGGLRYEKELASGDEYEGRTDLGNTEPGDGRLFKGAGVLQLTGRANYRVLSSKTNDLTVMLEGCDYVTKTYPFLSAGVWWELNDANAKIDAGANCYQISKLVNCGDMYSATEPNGYDSRLRYYNLACSAIV